MVPPAEIGDAVFVYGEFPVHKHTSDRIVHSPGGRVNHAILANQDLDSYDAGMVSDEALNDATPIGSRGESFRMSRWSPRRLFSGRVLWRDGRVRVSHFGIPAERAGRTRQVALGRMGFRRSFDLTVSPAASIRHQVLRLLSTIRSKAR